MALLLPAVCLACAQVSGRRLALGLCARCRARIAAAHDERCPVCGVELVGADTPEGFRCGGCAGRRPAIERLVALGAYGPPLSDVVVALKFGRLEHLGADCGRALARRFAAELGGAEVVVPLPLHWRRRLVRGYNQAESIARPLAEELGLPLRRVLRRRLATPPQSELPRADRRRSVRGAFVVRDPAAIAGRLVLLVDDVVTTGATLEEAARTLRRAGAASVLAAAVARTAREPLRG